MHGRGKAKACAAQRSRTSVVVRLVPAVIAPDVPFTEDTTFWNPSWTTAPGAVQTTDVYDLTTSMELVGNGALVSPKMYRLQTGKRLADFGRVDATGRCPACAELTEDRAYGLGVALLGPWIAQTKSFAGSGATTAYDPERKLTISVVTTYAPAAFDETGASDNASLAIFRSIADALAGDSPARS